MSANFDSYKHFYYVGKYKNISRAADALFLSQSTVSRSMQGLEAELGTKLFERSQHGIVLTHEGEVLYEQVVRACELIFIGEDKLQRLQNLSEGNIRIGVNDFTFQSFVIPVLHEFHKAYPSISLEVVSVENSLDGPALTECIDNRIDFACLSSHPGIDDADVVREDVIKFRDVPIAGEAYSELKNGSYYYYDITTKYPFVCRSDTASGANYITQLMTSKGIRFRPAYHVNDLSLFMPMVANGLCLAIVPNTYIEHFKESMHVFEISMKDPLPERDICILTSATQKKSVAIDEFIKRLKKYIVEKSI